MFFHASKVFALFLFPFPVFMIIALIALFRMQAGWIRRIYGLALLGILLLSSSFVSGALMAPLEDHYPYRTVAETREADVIVVLAGMITPLTGHEDRPEFLSAADRILAGEELLRAGRAPRLLISGGSGLMLQTGESEAVILERWLESRGWDADRILIEGGSRNTAENAIETAKILEERGWERVILVTSAFHMPRSMGCFRKAGIDARPFPVDYYRHKIFAGPESLVPSISGLRLSTIAFKEYVGLAAYRLRGYL